MVTRAVKRAATPESANESTASDQLALKKKVDLMHLTCLLLSAVYNCTKTIANIDIVPHYVLSIF
jgi:hypothetical protein